MFATITILALFNLHNQWDHNVLSKEGFNKETHWMPPKDICSPFYPEIGVYSTNEKILNYQLKQLQLAGVQMIVVPWWLSSEEVKHLHKHDARYRNGAQSVDDLISILLPIATKHNIKVTFMLKNHRGRSVSQIEGRTIYLQKYNHHPAIYKNEKNGLVLFIEDSNNLHIDEWINYRSRMASSSISSVQYIGTWSSSDEEHMMELNMDAIYVDTKEGWNNAVEWGNRRNTPITLFISPGRNELRIKPWLDKKLKIIGRQNGLYYKTQWTNAISLKPSSILINSFNDWCKGNQIEAASSNVNKQLEIVCKNGKCDKSKMCHQMMLRLGIPHMDYETYGSNPNMYMDLTAKYSQLYIAALNTNKHVTTTTDNNDHSIKDKQNNNNNIEPGFQFIGATFSQTFEKEGLLTAEVVDYTPPSPQVSNDVTNIETHGLYKVLYSDGDHAQLYYKELLKYGAVIPSSLVLAVDANPKIEL